MAKIPVRYAADGAAEVRKGWKPKGVKKLPTVTAIRKSDGAECVINKSWLEEFPGEYELVAENKPAIEPVVESSPVEGVPSDGMSKLDLARLPVSEIIKTSEWLALPSAVRDSATKKGDMIDAIVEAR